MDPALLARIAAFMPPTDGAAGGEELAKSTSPPVPKTTGPTLAHKGATASKLVHLVCFSKDRAFQLDQLLESSFRHLQAEGVCLKASVIYLPTLADDEGWTMSASYEMVAAKHPAVRFIREEPGGFFRQLRHAVAVLPPGEVGLGGAPTSASYVLFVVDDMFFYEDYPLITAVNILEEDPDIFSFHLKLNPCITWCHPARTPCTVPPLTPTTRRWAAAAAAAAGGGGEGGGEDLSSFDAFTFVRSEGSADWDYPWDLTGGIYRRADVEAVLAGMAEAYGEVSGSNPNLLEHNGHRLLSALASPPTSSTRVGTGSSTPPNPAAADAATAAASAVAASETATSETARAPSPSTAITVGPRSACTGRPVVSAVTVNRVQTSYDTPVYSAPGSSPRDLDRLLRGAAGEKGAVEAGAEAGAGSAGGGGGGGGGKVVLDAELYRARRFGSVHVGELALREQEPESEGCEPELPPAEPPAAEHRASQDPVEAMVTTTTTQRDVGGDKTAGGGGGGRGRGAPAGMAGLLPCPPPPAAAATAVAPEVTVLLPVHNGGDHLGEAVASVLRAQRGRRGCPPPRLELLLIDDGSRDGAVEALAGVLEGDPRVRVVRHRERGGLARRLNEGLREARAPLVARMDADDVCMPDRLWRQVNFMNAYPDIAAAGSSVAVFSTPPGGKNNTEGAAAARAAAAAAELGALPATAVQRIARHPTDPIFLRWALFFSCTMAHPSVIFRRVAALGLGKPLPPEAESGAGGEPDVAGDAGGGGGGGGGDSDSDDHPYSPQAVPAEDYVLWLRLQARDPGCVANLGEVLLGVRKHPENTSRRRRAEQEAAALAAATRAIGQALAGTGTGTAAATVAAAAGGIMPSTGGDGGGGGGEGGCDQGGRNVAAAPAAAAVSTAHVAALRNPEAAGSAGELAGAARLLIRLEQAVLAEAGGGSGDSGSPARAGAEAEVAEGEEMDSEEERGREMVSRDVEARLAALAVHSMRTFGAEAGPVLEAWVERCPGQQVAQLMLLSQAA